jgi:hypothetical protein
VDLGATLQIPSLQDLAIDALILTGPLNSALLGSLSSDVYERTGHDSQLRCFMAQTCAWNVESGDIEKFANDFDRHFIIDIWKALRTAVPEHAVGSNKQKIVGKDFYMEKD